MKRGCSKEQPLFFVLSTKYKVQSTLPTAGRQAGKIQKKHHLNNNTIPYFIIPKSALDIRHFDSIK